jgi:hypothetical protein
MDSFRLQAAVVVRKAIVLKWAWGAVVLSLSFRSRRFRRLARQLVASSRRESRRQAAIRLS